MAGGTITLSVEALETEAKSVAEIDAVLASAGGSEKAARKAVIESIVAEKSEDIDTLLNKVLDQLAKQDVAVLIGLQSKIGDALTEKFSAQIDEVVNAKVKETTSSLSKDEIAAKREDRKKAVDRFRALKDILESYGVDTSSVQEPKRSSRGGGGSGSGKSGKNREGYQFTMDGKDRPASQNTLSSLAFYSTIGCPKAQGVSDNEKDKWSTAQLKDFMAEKGVKYGEDETFEVTLPNGKVIGARRVEKTEEAPKEEAPAA